MEEFYKIIQEQTGLAIETQHKIVYSFLIVILFGLIRLIILRIVWRRTEDPKSRYIWKRSVSYLLASFGMLLIGAVWLPAFRQFGAFLGLFSAGLAIALKDPLTNLAGWLFIIIRKPFNVGDRIQVGPHAGDVIDMRIFQFTLLEIGSWVKADQSTGRIIHIPNGKVFTEPQINFNAGFQYIWHEIEVLVTFETNWQKAKAILLDIVMKHGEHITKQVEKEIREATKKFLIFYQHLTPIVYTKVMDSGVLLTMRFLCDPQKRRGTEHAIWEEVLVQFSQHDDIDFAYPTQRFYTLGEQDTNQKKQ